MTPASERKAKERQAKRDAGLVRVEVWVPRDMVEVVKQAVAQKEGHRKGAPLANTKGSVAPFEDYAALGKRIVDILAAKPLRRAEIEKIMGRAPESLYNTMRRLATTGAVVSLAHRWYLPHQLPAEHPVKRLSLPHAAE